MTLLASPDLVAALWGLLGVAQADLSLDHAEAVTTAALTALSILATTDKGVLRMPCSTTQRALRRWQRWQLLGQSTVQSSWRRGGCWW